MLVVMKQLGFLIEITTFNLHRRKKPLNHKQTKLGEY